MAKRPLNEGTRYDYRVGKGGFAFGGMMQDPDPGALPPNRPRMVVNGRFQGGGIVSRPPYVPKITVNPNLWYDHTDKTLSTTFSSQWQPKFIAAHSPQVNNELWAGWFSPTAGAVIGRAGFAGDPSSQTIAEFPSLIQRANPVARWNGYIYVGDQAHLKKIYRLGDDGDGNNIALGSLPPDETLYTFPNAGGSARHVSVLHAHDDGKLYMVVDDANAIANTKIYSWDGNVLVEELDTGASWSDGAALYTFNSQLAAVFDQGATGTLRLRDTDGNWATISPTGAGAPPNDFVFGGYINGMCSAGNTLYIGCGSNGWWTYNETTGLLTQPGIAGGIANVCTTIGDRVFLVSGGVTGGGAWIYTFNASGSWSTTLVIPPAIGYRSTPTACSGVARRLQVGWMTEQISPPGSTLYGMVSYGTPGSFLEEGLVIQEISNSSVAPFEYFTKI